MSEPSAAVLSRGQRFVVACAPLLVRLLRLTWRVRLVNDSGWRARRQRSEPFIFTLWHGQMLPLLLQHRDEGIAVLISDHRDGELIARIAKRFGCRTVRGSTTRGGTRALLAVVRVLAEGGDMAITPDGPRGPAYSFAAGALVAAQRAGVPIVGMGVHASRAWRLKSWDAFMIPKPFATVTIAYSTPTFVDAPDARLAAEQTAQFQRLMNDTVAQAQLTARDGLGAS